MQITKCGTPNVLAIVVPPIVPIGVRFPYSMLHLGHVDGTNSTHLASSKSWHVSVGSPHALRSCVHTVTVPLVGAKNIESTTAQCLAKLGHR